MAGRARPTKAPHLLATGTDRPVSRSSKAVIEEDYGDDEDYDLAKEHEAVFKLRSLVADAKLKEPSLFEGELSFYQVAAAIERASGDITTGGGWSKKRLIHLIRHGIGIKNLANAMRIHCSDLLNLAGGEDVTASHGGGANVTLEDPFDDSELLPCDWSRHLNEDGIPYYFNECTGESQWENPGLDVEARQGSGESQREQPKLDAEACRDSDTQFRQRCLRRESERKGTGEYVEMLQTTKDFTRGDILQVGGRSNSGSSIKVIIGQRASGFPPRMKCLVYTSEGILWRWTSPPPGGAANV